MMVSARSGNIGTGMVKLPPIRPTTMAAPPLATDAVREGERLVGAGEIDRRADAAAGCLGDGLARAGVGRIEGLGRAELQRRLALGLVDVGDEDRLVGQRAGELQPHHADAAEADDQQRPGAQIGHAPS